jgi:hypothetical protein
MKSTSGPITFENRSGDQAKVITCGSIKRLLYKDCVPFLFNMKNTLRR